MFQARFFLEVYIKKIFDILIEYYIAFLLVLALAIIFCGYNPNLLAIVKDLYPVKASIMMFAWYVPFYIEAMLVLPFISKLFIKYGNRKTAYICIAAYIILEFILCIGKVLDMRGDYWFVALQAFKRTMPFMIIGFYMRRDLYFEQVKEVFQEKGYLKPKYLYGILLLIIAASIFNDKILGLKSGILYTPIYLFCVAALQLSNTNNDSLKSFYSFLAKHSANIWFLHCIFFAGATKAVFQPIAFLPQNTFLSVAWIILLCSVVSVIISPIQIYTKNKINRYL